jgi:hypothetical protein
VSVLEILAIKDKLTMDKIMSLQDGITKQDIVALSNEVTRSLEYCHGVLCISGGDC